MSGLVVTVEETLISMSIVVGIGVGRVLISAVVVVESRAFCSVGVLMSANEMLDSLIYKPLVSMM